MFSEQCSDLEGATKYCRDNRLSRLLVMYRVCYPQEMSEGKQGSGGRGVVLGGRGHDEVTKNCAAPSLGGLTSLPSVRVSVGDDRDEEDVIAWHVVAVSWNFLWTRGS